MPITPLGLAASLTSDNSGGFPTTSTFNTTRDINAGELVVLGIGANGSATAPSSVTVGSLSLTKDENDTGTYALLNIWSGYTSSLIASGSTVSVNMNGSFRDFILFTFTGSVSSSFLNSHINGNQAAGVSNDYNLNLTTVNDGVVVRGTRWTSNAVSASPGSGFTEVGEISNATSGTGTQFEYGLFGASTVTTSVTLTGSPSAEEVSAGYSGLAVAGPTLQFLRSPYRLN